MKVGYVKDLTLNTAWFKCDYRTLSTEWLWKVGCTMKLKQALDSTVIWSYFIHPAILVHWIFIGSNCSKHEQVFRFCSVHSYLFSVPLVSPSLLFTFLKWILCNSSNTLLDNLFGIWKCSPSFCRDSQIWMSERDAMLVLKPPCNPLFWFQYYLRIKNNT